MARQAIDVADEAERKAKDAKAAADAAGARADAALKLVPNSTPAPKPKPVDPNIPPPADKIIEPVLPELPGGGTGGGEGGTGGGEGGTGGGEGGTGGSYGDKLFDAIVIVNNTESANTIKSVLNIAIELLRNTLDILDVDKFPSGSDLTEYIKNLKVSFSIQEMLDRLAPLKALLDLMELAGNTDILMRMLSGKCS